MLNTVNYHGRLLLQTTCDGCGKTLGEPEKCLNVIIERTDKAGWLTEGYDMDEIREPYRACHYCCTACRERWEAAHPHAKRRNA